MPRPMYVKILTQQLFRSCKNRFVGSKGGTLWKKRNTEKKVPKRLMLSSNKIFITCDIKKRYLIAYSNLFLQYMFQLSNVWLISEIDLLHTVVQSCIERPQPVHTYFQLYPHKQFGSRPYNWSGVLDNNFVLVLTHNFPQESDYKLQWELGYKFVQEYLGNVPSGLA